MEAIETCDNHEALDDHRFAGQVAALRVPLINFSQKRWPTLLSAEYERRMSRPHVGNDRRGSVTFETLCTICCTARLPDKRLPVQVFAAEAPGLSGPQRATLLRWNEVREPPFRIEEVGQQTVVVSDPQHGGSRLVVHPCGNQVKWQLVRPGGLLLARLVPVRDFFIHLGHFLVCLPEHRKPAIRHLRNEVGSQRRPDRWTPQEGGPAPDPQAPCPCHSGRRYRKCCMPR